jgi:hypothetical protein
LAHHAEEVVVEDHNFHSGSFLHEATQFLEGHLKGTIANHGHHLALRSGHFGPNGKPTTPEDAHYGHTTIVGDDKVARRYDYQKQHILHPRLVNVPERKKNKKTGKMETVDHMIPTDSRFMDTEFLPKNRFKSKNGKEAGHILMTTPTESTGATDLPNRVGYHRNHPNHRPAARNRIAYSCGNDRDST